MNGHYCSDSNIQENNLGKSFYSIFCFLLLIFLLNVPNGTKSDIYCWYDENKKETDPSNDHSTICEYVSLQEKLVPQVTHFQLIISKQNDGIYPQSQMTCGCCDEYHCIVGIGNLSIFAIYHCKYHQFQRQLCHSKYEDNQIEMFQCWLYGALQSRCSEEHEEGGHEYDNLCEEGGGSFLIDLKQFRAHQYQTAILILWTIYQSWLMRGRTIIMSLLEKKQLKYAIGAIGVGAFLFGAFKFYKYLCETNGPPSILSTNYDDLDEEEKEALSMLSKSKQHTPYEYLCNLQRMLIEDLHRDKVTSGRVGYMDHLKDIHYKLILSLMKGNSYQGIVTISFWLDRMLDIHQFFPINYNGGGVKFIMVNGKKLETLDVRYQSHLILIPKELLIEKGKNNIEIIFQNLYSFIDNGLSAYFTIDDHHKYSLRQQVIYSVNGNKDIQRFMPCINCFNQCKVRLQVIHPDTFQVFSNTSKSLERLCSVNQYQKYPFLFDLSSSSLNKSFKLNQSTISSYSNLGQSAATTSYSSINYHNRKKANTHFYKEKLPSIHHLFVFCSSMIELQPNSSSSQLQSELLLRYFCKPSESHRLGRGVNMAHKYILDIFRRLAGDNIKDFVNKIDILIIADRQVEGYFAPGVLILNEDSLTSASIDIRCLYLIVRALLGLLQLQKGKNVVTLQEMLILNQTVYQRFEEFRNYLFIKNRKFQHLRMLVNSKEKKSFLMNYEGYFLKYFSKQLKFLLKENNQDKISFQLKNLMLSFSPQTQQQFWQNFISTYNFLSPLIIEPLIKLGIRVIGVPTKFKLLQQLRQLFYQSKYILSFYTNQQISDNLPAFIEKKGIYGLQERLTKIKVKQKFKDSITQRQEKYLPIRSNMTEAESRYIQLKKFSESKNFHHISVLKSQIKRVCYFGTKFLYPQRIHIDCSIVGWKLLSKLKLYPADEQYYALIKEFQNIL